MATQQAPARDVPRNGIAGLKHIRHDILSGIVVSLVSLPLSSGIAIASGAPPIYGLISAIIAGLIFPLIGGAYMTISGPAAGLAPALLAIMAALGGAGDAEHVGAGYPHLLVVIFLVGVIQMVLALLKFARVAAIIPMSVVEGMLAAIGLLIIVKQLPMFFGYAGQVHAHEFYHYAIDAPVFALGMDYRVVAVSGSCLALLFFLGSLTKVGFVKVVPPQLVAVICGMAIGQAVGLSPAQLISLPKDAFHGVHLPNFAALLARQDLWYAAVMGVVTLTMIDGVESLATAMAIDRIDPYRRKSQPNRLLFAMGLSNVASSLVGGLTIIPGGVKSKANIASGGRTLWANFTNAVCLILYLLVARDLINLIPKGALAAVLIYTGYKMCEPLVWKHMAHIGKEQLGIFTLTVVATLMTDLLWGIAAGVTAKFLLNMVLYRYARAASAADGSAPSVWRSIRDFVESPIGSAELQGTTYHIHLERPLVCFNSMRLGAALGRMPKEATAVVLHLDDQVGLIDHTSCENLMEVVQQFSESACPVTIEGLDRMQRLSHYEHGTHVAVATLAPA